MPITLPGKVKFSLTGENTGVLNRADLDLKIVRESFINIPLPCLSNVGSCKYKNLCTILDRMEKENWAGISAKLAGNIREMVKNLGLDPYNYCPVGPIKVDAKDVEVDLPEVPSILSTFATGD